MHKKMIKNASEEQLREFLDDAMEMIKETNHELYETLEDYLYVELYGCHFNEWLLEHATDRMMNEDGTIGKHWSLEETSNVAKQYNVKMVDFNAYDWCYVLNMMYSDYYGAVSNDIGTYCKMAVKFLNDKDAEHGKAYHYYIDRKKHSKK